jgi:MFS family permease
VLLGRSLAYRWVILAVAYLSVFGAMGLSRFGYSAVLPDMEESLGLTGAQAGSLASWNLAAYMLMALMGGFLASRFGPRLVVTAGMLITTAGLLLTGFSDGLAGASAARFLTGLGNGLVFAPSLSLLVAWFPATRLGFASTVVSSATGLGLVVAGPVVPRLLDAAGGSWRVAWYFFAAVTALMVILTVVFQRNRPQEAALARTPAGLERRSLRSELRSDLRSILRSRYTWHMGVIYLLYGFAYVLYLTFFQKRLTADLGFSTESAGDLFLLAGLCSIVVGVFGGVVADRIGRGRALAIVLALQGVGALLFGLRLGTPALVISAVLFGVGVFSVAGLIGAACGDQYGARLVFIALGFVTIFIGLGQALGPYVGGSLEDRFGSLGPSYLLAAGLFALAAVTALFLPDARPGCVPRGA